MVFRQQPRKTIDNLAKSPDSQNVISTIRRNLVSCPEVTAKDFSLSLEMTVF